MNTPFEFLFFDGKFLGIAWSAWKVIGLLGNVVFSCRFLVQWHATEKRKQVVIPVAFWWLSLVGSLLILIYALHKRDSVFILSFAFTWIPYIRSLIIHYRYRAALVTCVSCELENPPFANFCSNCGMQLKGTGKQLPTGVDSRVS